MSVRDVIQAAAGASTTADKTYIEDVFSTYLYTGNGATQTINNGIQLGAVYGGSVYFNGLASPNTDRLSIANTTQLDFGTGDFTVECWFNSSKAPAGYTYQAAILFGKGNGVETGQWGLTYYQGFLSVSISGSTYTGSIAIPANTWTHIAVSRQSGTLRTFINGTLDATASNSANVTSTTTFNIGDRQASDPYAQYPFNGYISNIRIVKGAALYTFNFTPSTTPLTAVSGTALLTCQNPNPILDYSSNALTITNTNATSTTGSGPFNDPSLAKGGMVWIKNRGSSNHTVYDTNRGANAFLGTNTTVAQDSTNTYNQLSFGSSGFTVATANSSFGEINVLNNNFASWTFRKAPKFFDVVTYTGDGNTSKTINHSLGSTPGMMIIKKTSAADNWAVYHRSLGATKYIVLNLTADAGTASVVWNNTEPTSTQFTVGSAAGVNQSGATYVAYLFAHDTTTDGLIQCGSFTAGASGFSEVNLGWEPQYILFKTTSVSQDWYVWDTMRGMALTSSVSLQPNLSNAEFNWGSSSYVYPTTKGFAGSGNFFGNGANVIYMAIRRGPMRTPTDGTKVFKPYSTDSVSNSGSSISSLFNAGFVVDALLQKAKAGTDGWYTGSRLTATKYMKTETTAAEASSSVLVWDSNVGAAQYAASYGQYCFRRAPGFFDVVCYTGTSADRTINHNLGVVPELMIVKRRSAIENWYIYSAALGTSKYLQLNKADAQVNFGIYLWTATAPTNLVFSIASDTSVNASGSTYIAYLFASCPGVSKVFSFTGNGSSQTINCGFTNGARLVLIKRTDSTGDWYVWDTARGIVAGNDPHLSLNSTAAEVTTNDTIDPDSTGFIVNQVSATNVNVNGASYIGLAIA